VIAKPLSYKQACEFISAFHRHHRPPQGWKFGLAAIKNDNCVGVVCVGRPVSRMLDDGTTLEVTRLCSDGTRNVCSFLYSKARRIAFEMGYVRIITYILDEEPGISLRAAGWKKVRDAGGGSWSRPSRSRVDKAPLNKKQLWEAVA
jgi:hypothetical protein